MNNTWYVILNPTSGNGKGLKKIEILKRLFLKYDLPVKIKISEYSKHEKLLAQNAINNGFKKIISVGGDGTLHHIINGVMSQTKIINSAITIGVIPLGTGNDWVKTYDIPLNIEKAIQIIRQNKHIYQDVGKIRILKSDKCYYFNNIAGIGFDAYVVNKINKLKRLGSMAYLLGGIIGFMNYKESRLTITLDNNNNNKTSNIFMLNIGLCKYSGGGLRLTDYDNHKSGFFDVTIIESIKLLKILLNIKQLFNGNLRKFKEARFSNNKVISIKTMETHIPYIQADGELIGNGNTEISIVNKAIKIIVN